MGWATAYRVAMGACASVGLAVGTGGCGFFEDAVVKVSVVSLQVAPVSGNGPFTAALELSAHSAAGPVRCEATGGADVVYDQVVPPAATNQTITFEFQPKVPGPNKLVCWPRDGERYEGAKDAFFAVPIVTPAIRTDPSSSGSCTLPTTDTFTFSQVGAVQIASLGPGVVDHTSCTQSGSTTAWYLDGTYDPVSGVVTVASCNSGRFQGAGALSVSGANVTGSATCSYQGELRNTQTYGG